MENSVMISMGQKMPKMSERPLKTTRLPALQAEYEGSIPFTRSIPIPNA
jgi:hypothetical protein